MLIYGAMLTYAPKLPPAFAGDWHASRMDMMHEVSHGQELKLTKTAAHASRILEKVLKPYEGGQKLAKHKPFNLKVTFIVYHEATSV